MKEGDSQKRVEGNKCKIEWKIVEKNRQKFKVDLSCKISFTVF